MFVSILKGISTSTLKVTLILISAAVLLQFGVGADAFGQAADTDQSFDGSDLRPEEQQVLHFLKEDWDLDLSSTSVDLAMDTMGLDSSDADFRFRIGSYIKSHPELHLAVRTWGWETLVLRADEKLIGRAILMAMRDGKPSPSLADLAVQLGISQDKVRTGLEMMARFEILRREAGSGGSGYVLANERYQKWESRLDFQFHPVRLSSGRQFNTN